MKAVEMCPIGYKCGGCDYSFLPYDMELDEKQEQCDRVLHRFGPVAPIMRMRNPLRHRDKVQSVIGLTQEGNIISGLYRKGTHRIVPVKDCSLEFELASPILKTIRSLMKSFGLRPYDEDTGSGDLRHVLLRRAHNTGEILVVLIFGSDRFRLRKEFAKAIASAHPEIKSVTAQTNGEKTSMVLSDDDCQILVGDGYITDVLLGLKFRISSKSFCQINSTQTEALYDVAIKMARLREDERAIDAYCGTGTIALLATRKCKGVLGIELNAEAVNDARVNAKINGIENAEFVEADASTYMKALAKQKEHYDCVFLDPPRSGSDERFLSSLMRLSPDRIIYISCNLDTLKRDLRYLESFGPYRVYASQPVDMFPRTEHVETVVLMSRKDT